MANLFIANESMDLFLFVRLAKRKVGTIFRTMWLDLLTRRIEFVVAGNTSKLGCKDAILISGRDAIEGGSWKEKEERDLDKRNRGDWKCNSRSASSFTLVNRYWNEQQDEEDYSLFGLKRNWKFPPPLLLCFFSFFWYYSLLEGQLAGLRAWTGHFTHRCLD